jgi:hypothetical protein
LRSRGRVPQLFGQTYANLLEYFVDEFVKSNVEENVRDVPGLKRRYTKRRKHVSDVARGVRVPRDGV